MFPTYKENPRMYNLISALLLVLIVFFAVQIWKGSRQASEVGLEPREPNVITLEGEGKISGVPDLARVDIGLLSEGADIPKIQAENTAKVNAMLRALRDLGIQEADIQTSNYNISPIYRYDEGRQTVSGYMVSQNVSVKVRDLAKVGSVIARVGELGANQVNGVTFTLDEPAELQAEARKLAIEDAKDKAAELSRALGVKVVRIITFSESPGGTPIPYPMNLKSLEDARGSTAPEIQPGTLDVASRVSITFEIR